MDADKKRNILIVAQNTLLYAERYTGRQVHTVNGLRASVSGAMQILASDQQNENRWLDIIERSTIKLEAALKKG